MRLQGKVKLDKALWLLGSLCGLFHIPFDASHIALAPSAPPASPEQSTDAATHLAPELLLVARESTASDGEPDDIAGFTTEPKAFGFSWFIPELLKHKRLWRDVLLASLAIQIVGLSTPLFTQVIIDKVVVHQSSSTLIVLGVALVMFKLFTSGMSWLRQYLVLHTGNRIDAVLGSQVLSHLLRLPLPYYEQRLTGTLVARLHGVETIREFVSGAAVTLILDFPPWTESVVDMNSCRMKLLADHSPKGGLYLFARHGLVQCLIDERLVAALPGFSLEKRND